MKVYKINTKELLDIEYIQSNKGIFYPQNLTTKQLLELGYKPVRAEGEGNAFEIKETDSECILTYSTRIDMTALENEFKTKVQAILDAKAQAKGYDNIVSAVSYAGYENDFQAEAKAFGRWRASVWKWGYSLIEKAKSGEVSVENINLEEVLNEMPTLELENENI